MFYKAPIVLGVIAVLVVSGLIVFFRLYEEVFQVLTLTAVVFAIFGSSSWLWEHLLKIQAEKRIAESDEVESKVKLIQLFTELMKIAHSRDSHVVSKEVLETLLDSKEAECGKSEDGLWEPKKLAKLLQKAVIPIPVGSAAQDAAIAAIAELGEGYTSLRNIAIRGLCSLYGVKPCVVAPYLEAAKRIELSGSMEFTEFESKAQSVFCTIISTGTPMLILDKDGNPAIEVRRFEKFQPNLANRLKHSVSKYIYPTDPVG